MMAVADLPRAPGRAGDTEPAARLRRAGNEANNPTLRETCHDRV